MQESAHRLGFPSAVLELVSSKKLKLRAFQYILFRFYFEYKLVPSGIHCCNAIVEEFLVHFWLKSMKLSIGAYFCN